MANRALELLGTELGMFRNDGPPKPITLEDLSTEDLNRLLADPTADEDITPTVTQLKSVAKQRQDTFHLRAPLFDTTHTD